ncbi:flippase [Patescibacteria group bacterium]|nr:flippase [Patescibacteria group bacterium]
MNKVANIAKNTSYLTLALVIQKVISFSYFIILARFLGLESLGQYYTAISFTTIFSIFIDFGFANVLTREVAKNQEQASDWLRSVLGIKLMLAAVTIVAAVLVAYFAYDPKLLLLIVVSCLSMFLDSFTTTFFAVVRGFHNLKFESIASVIFQFIVLGLGYLLMRAGYPLFYLLLAIVVASLFNFLYSAAIVKKYLHLKIRPQWNLDKIKLIFNISWPFALYQIFQRLFTYLDTLLLGFIAGYGEVGLYQIAFKIIFALQFLPMAFNASLYPAMSAYWQNNREQLLISFERAINYLLIISLPIIFGIFALADKIVPLFKAGPEAVWPLRISILALVFIFLNFPVGALLNACDRQRRNTANMAIVTFVSLGLNLFFIPQWQALGASITVLISNFLMLLLGLFSMRGLIVYRPAKNAKTLLAALSSAFLMALIIYFFKQYVHIFIAVIIGGIIYFVALMPLGGIKKADIRSIITSFRRS